jgi:integrase
MARTPKNTPPSYPKKPHNGQARITIRLPDGRRHDLLLGTFGSPESRAEYRRVLAELESNSGRYRLKEDGSVPSGLTVSELCLRFWQHAEQYYRLADGSPSGEQVHFEYALKPVVDLYGHTLATEFGPLKLKAVRQQMIDTYRYLIRSTEGSETLDKWVHENRLRQMADQPDKWEIKSNAGWELVEILDKKQTISRKVVNQRIDHIKRVFKWAVSEELVPPSVYEALKTVAGLRRGRSGTYDRPKVKPVSPQHVEAVLPYLCPQVSAMVQLQELIGARETEICVLRGRNIDKSGSVWWYTIDPNEVTVDGQPANQHKTAHHEDSDGYANVKMLPIGPKAQEILGPWLRENADEYVFQPREARQSQNAERRKTRETPLWPSHVKHQAKKKKATPKRAPKDRYDRHSYARAIARACQKANVPHWHPHQLKHSCGTVVRKKYGLEAARAYMGHNKVSTAEIYAEKDMEMVEKIALEMG